MSDVWQRALDPTQRTVLGLTLQPLTLGHVFVLSEIDCAILSPGGKPTIEDMIKAAFVCAQPWRESQRDMRKRRRFALFMKYWGWKCRKIKSIEKSIDELNAYVSDALAMPEMRCKGEFKDRATPWHWRLLVILMVQLRMSIDQAMDTTVAFANMLRIGKDELDDAVQMTPPGERDLWDVAHERDLERAKN